MGGKGSGGARKNGGVKPGATMDMSEDLSHRVSSLMMKLAKLPQINLSDSTAIWNRFEEFIQLCDEHSLRPSVANCSLALGFGRQQMYAIVRRQIKSTNNFELTPDCYDTIQKIYNFLESVMDSCCMDDKGSPVKYFFLAKNHFGYKDQTERINVNIEERKALPTSEDVLQKYAAQLGAPVELIAEKIEDVENL